MFHGPSHLHLRDRRRLRRVAPPAPCHPVWVRVRVSVALETFQPPPRACRDLPRATQPPAPSARHA
eukprot:3854315-Pyramimonas_sp.AAC.1